MASVSSPLPVLIFPCSLGVLPSFNIWFFSLVPPMVLLFVLGPPPSSSLGVGICARHMVGFSLSLVNWGGAHHDVPCFGCGSFFL